MVTFILLGLLSLQGRPSRDTVLPIQPLRQGIEGRVTLAAGNLMPSPGARRVPSDGGGGQSRSGRPVGGDSAGARYPGLSAGRGYADSLFIYELTNINQVVRQSAGAPYYLAIHSLLVRSAATDSAGRFRIGLPPGQYSIFTKKGNLFYASRMDEKNNIAPVVVMPGRMTILELRVASDHKPVY